MAAPNAFKYEAVPGFFEHDDEPTGPEFRAATKVGLGLIDRAYDTDAAFDPERRMTQWERFVHFLKKQNEVDDGKVAYKLIFVTRHGEGFHNVKEAEVGRHEWDNHWSFLDGDENMNWFDSFLTEKGKQQAAALNAIWRESTETLKMPLPEECYTSPHARTLETSRIAYSGLATPENGPLRPVVKERLRERTGEHTCDRRRTKSWITSNYPDYEIEPGFAENDEIWKADVRESEAEVETRIRALLDDIFEHSKTPVIAFTCHSGFIRGLYGVTKHRDVWISAGTMVPLLVKAEPTK
ncbi:histidine phosphatase superfamily [Xylariomycetidae sp. FL0641]|nr:histidine phosphatase superfamily [Xylariomycetidae sp. FL0641]